MGRTCRCAVSDLIQKSGKMVSYANVFLATETLLGQKSAPGGKQL